ITRYQRESLFCPYTTHFRSLSRGARGERRCRDARRRPVRADRAPSWPLLRRPSRAAQRLVVGVVGRRDLLAVDLGGESGGHRARVERRGARREGLVGVLAVL